MVNAKGIVKRKADMASLFCLGEGEHHGVGGQWKIREGALEDGVVSRTEKRTTIKSGDFRIAPFGRGDSAMNGFYELAIRNPLLARLLSYVKKQ